LGHAGFLMEKPSTVLEHISALLSKEAPAPVARRAPEHGDPVILSITGASAYGSLDALLAMLGREWTHAGARILGVSLDERDWPDRLSRAIGSHRIEFCVCMSGMALEIAERARSLWDEMRFPVFCLQCDHPAYFHSRHRRLPHNVVLGYLFRDHAVYQRDHVKAANLVTSVHFGIPDLPLADPDTADGPRVVFAKTGNDPRELETRWRALPHVEPLIRDSLDEVGLGSCEVYPDVVRRVAAAHGIELQPFDRLTRFLIVQIDDYVRRRKSTAIAEVIKRFPVDIYGANWEHIDRDGARARFHGGVDYETVNQTIAHATASVTMNPNIELSAHDRFFTALGMGVMPLSDGNRFIRENFRGLAPYTFGFGDGSLEAALEHVFAHPSDALDLARSTKAQMIPRFPVRQAAKQIKDCVALAEYFDFSFASPQPFFAL
jgi:hypothetical protein